MNAAYERLVQHLDEHDVRYRANSDAGSICADFQGEVGTYRLIASVDDDGTCSRFSRIRLSAFPRVPARRSRRRSCVPTTVCGPGCRSRHPSVRPSHPREGRHS